MNWIERAEPRALEFAVCIVNQRTYAPADALKQDADIHRAYNSKMAEAFAADSFWPGEGERHISFSADAPDGGVDFVIPNSYGPAKSVDVKWTPHPDARKLIVNDGKLDRLPDYLIAVSGSEPGQFHGRGWCSGTWFGMMSRPTGDPRGGRYVALADLCPIFMLLRQFVASGPVEAAL